MPAEREKIPGMVERARSLRQTTTKPEMLLWNCLRNSTFAGKKFRRQYPIGPYVADFCCYSEKLLIELDGDSHDFTEKQDTVRTAYLQTQGYRVIRFSNGDVLENIDSVLFVIARELGVEWKDAWKKSDRRKMKKRSVPSKECFVPSPGGGTMKSPLPPGEG